MHALDRSNIRIELWERGAGYTLASGSSSTAAAATAYKLGMCAADITVHMPGGELKIRIAPDFSLENTSKGKVGFLICTEIWFNSHAREYGKQGMQLLVCPRATPNPTAPKWVMGGQAAAVISGAFCFSFNLGSATSGGDDYTGVG